MNYCIIGNSVAAVGAVEGIRSKDKKGPITMISAEPYHTYSRPLISYYMAGKVKPDNMKYRPTDFYKKNNVDLKKGITASKIDECNKKVLLSTGGEISYDKLLIATGGKPIFPAIEGSKKENVFTFQKLDDVKNIKKVLKSDTKAVIIGAGLIGMKAAESLAVLGIKLTVVELADRLLSSILDKEAAGLVQGVMEKHGVEFIFQNTVKKVLGEKKAAGVELADGRAVPCDLLIVAIGVIPNTDIVKDISILVNRGVVVNEKMATSVNDIYAAGDVAEGHDAVLGTQRVIPILPNAYRQGETAGLNMTGHDTSFNSGFPMNSIGFFECSMATAGVSSGEGYEELTLLEEGEKIYRKIVLKNDKVVGFIALNDVNRIGILTSLIAKGTSIKPFKESLLKRDFGYIDWPTELRRDRLLAGGGTW